MAWLTQTVGVILVSLALADIFLTVLYVRREASLLSRPLNHAVWHLFRAAARRSGRACERVLCFSGPTIMVLTVAFWMVLLTVGFALIFWPAMGTGIRAVRGATPTDFIAALYFSGYNLSTLGNGDLMPATSGYRLLTILEAAAGFSFFTLSITYVLTVYGTLVRRNAFALSLYHRSGRTGDAAELLARLGAGGDFSGARQELHAVSTEVLYLLESHHSYPVLHYFYFPQSYYALARIGFLVMDTASLAESALDEEARRRLAADGLWSSGMHMLAELHASYRPPRPAGPGPHSREEPWRERFYRAVERLQVEGIETTADLEAGAERYAALRREWEPLVSAFAAETLRELPSAAGPAARGQRSRRAL